MATSAHMWFHTRSAAEPATGAVDRARELTLREGEEQVAEEDGGVHPECVRGTAQSGVRVPAREVPVCGRLAAPRVRVIDDVVVDEGRRLEEFERRASQLDRILVPLRIGPAACPPEPGEYRTAALPAGQEAARGFHEHRHVTHDCREV